MREIKFRAWDKKEKKMYSWGEILNHAKNFDRFNNVVSIFLDNSNLNIMQYTGLKDKNDIEIYEGDIMLHGKLTYPVVFDELGWRLITITSKGHRINTYIDVKKDKVIGNIYENPELLKEESK
ncbi:MAG: YopX family protein [Cyclobacteriaceae bacterium]